MTKKKLLVISLMTALLSLSSVHVNAQAPSIIDLEVGYIDPSSGEGGTHRANISVPYIGIDGHVLTFYSPCDGCTLCLSDENNNTVYTTVIPVGADALALPSYLSGDYKIEIIQGIFCFWGYIEL